MSALFVKPKNKKRSDFSVGLTKDPNSTHLMER